MRFKIIVATYNPPPGRFEHCLKMLEMQTYKDFDVCIVDDNSDGYETHDIAEEYQVWNPWAYIRNDERRGAMYNQVMAIREICDDPDDVIVFCDGDDALAHDGVLEKLNQVYADPDVELTYGSYQPVPPSATCPPVRAFPPSTIALRDYRSFTRDNGIYWNHLRTFKYKLFQQMDEADWRDENGEWLMCCPDIAMMTAALELAEKHVYIPDVLYHYTSDNPISEWRVHLTEIQKNSQFIYSQPKKERT